MRRLCVGALDIAWAAPEGCPGCDTIKIDTLLQQVEVTRQIEGATLAEVLTKPIQQLGLRHGGLESSSPRVEDAWRQLRDAVLERSRGFPCNCRDTTTSKISAAALQTEGHLPGLIRALNHELVDPQHSPLLRHLCRAAAADRATAITVYYGLLQQERNERFPRAILRTFLECLPVTTRTDLFRGAEFVDALEGLKPVSDEQKEKPYLKNEIYKRFKRLGVIPFVNSDEKERRLMGTAIPVQEPFTLPSDPEMCCTAIDLTDAHVKKSAQDPVVFRVKGKRVPTGIAVISTVDGEGSSTSRSVTMGDTLNDGMQDSVVGEGMTELLNLEVMYKCEDMRKDWSVMGIMKRMKLIIDADPGLQDEQPIPVIPYGVLPVARNAGQSINLRLSVCSCLCCSSNPTMFTISFFTF